MKCKMNYDCVDRSYDSSYKCFQEQLDNERCPIGPQLFSEIADQDTIELGQYICSAGITICLIFGNESRKIRIVTAPTFIGRVTRKRVKPFNTQH